MQFRLLLVGVQHAVLPLVAANIQKPPLNVTVYFVGQLWELNEFLVVARAVDLVLTPSLDNGRYYVKILGDTKSNLQKD